MLSVRDTVYQNGIECDSLVISDYADSNTEMNKVKANVEYEVVVDYHLQDTSGDIEIVVEPLFKSKNDEPLCRKIYKIN